MEPFWTLNQFKGLKRGSQTSWPYTLGPGDRGNVIQVVGGEETYIAGRSASVGRASLAGQLTPQSPLLVPFIQGNHGQTDSDFGHKSVSDAPSK